MTRSIFDPTGNETEHSGSQNLGPDASEISHMPPGLAQRDEDADGDDETIDVAPIEPAAIEPVDLSEADAPQEREGIDDPFALMEGQPTDTSDAPQESSE
jgi:hypothetical protein